ncbi:histone-lysine N-methyltransferase, H3 lysine-79 specific isoform X2 [Octopus sinensis]|uniref:Histone-lysine N-methyltransferase, H3 lysine-79 specific isoform X2 n=1 Tax=Octopus sinensis TaxID=2607531 RepID=A0A7E6FV96_9MOLL|nr:histone-lysine N-methyltransferase, H3 lysine-79 specific isoform X2 [Octopus sinensis]
MQDIWVSSMFKSLGLQNKLEHVGLVGWSEADHQNLIPEDGQSDTASNEEDTPHIPIEPTTTYSPIDCSISLNNNDDDDGDGDGNKMESGATTSTDACFNMDSFFPAPPLQDLYRYHIFFSHSPNDIAWIESIVKKLEECPYNYKCFYTKPNSSETSQSNQGNPRIPSGLGNPSIPSDGSSPIIPRSQGKCSSLNNDYGIPSIPSGHRNPSIHSHNNYSNPSIPSILISRSSPSHGNSIGAVIKNKSNNNSNCSSRSSSTRSIIINNSINNNNNKSNPNNTINSSNCSVGGGSDDDDDDDDGGGGESEDGVNIKQRIIHTGSKNKGNSTSKTRSSNGTIQSTLCAAMLSERVVIALSRSYVLSTWFDFQEILQNLTESSLYQQRLIVIMLEDCEVPEPLQTVGYLDVRQKQFYSTLTQLLRSNCLPRSSESISSDLSSVLSTRANLSNGQLIATITGRINGQWKATLVFDYDGTVPTPLSCHGINVSHNEFTNIMKNIVNDAEIMNSLGWQFTMKPVVIIFILSIIWIVSFLLVIFLLIDAPKSSALPIRLAVFLFPLLLLMAGYALRRMQKQNCATLNLNFCLSEFTDSLTEKLLALIQFYTMDPLYLSQNSMAEKLVVMLGAPYSQQLLHRLLLKPSQEYHIRGHMCLCQYAEEFLLHYFGSIENSESMAVLDSVFSKYLNCSIRKKSLNTVKEMLKLTDDDHPCEQQQQQQQHEQQQPVI